MAKATHTGTCQICGATQKLPNGALSKHGYTVDYGWFNGVCSGAHGKPFEESTDLIEEVISSVTAQRVKVLEEAANLENETSFVWINAYFKKVSQPQWVKVSAEDLIIEHKHYEEDTFLHVNVDIEGTYGPEKISWHKGNTPDEKIIFENQKYAKHLTNQAAMMQNYIEWQTERVANWKPGKLTPVK